MAKDSIVDEIHAIRDEIAKEYNYDLRAIVQAMRNASAESGRQVVSSPAKPPSKSKGDRKAG